MNGFVKHTAQLGVQCCPGVCANPVIQAGLPLITAGLDYLAASYELWSTKGRLPYAHPELRWLPKSFDRGRYSADFMQQVLAVRPAARQVRHHGGRLYDLTAFQVARLILAVRVVAQNVRHGHFKTYVKDLARRCSGSSRSSKNTASAPSSSSFLSLALNIAMPSDRNGKASSVGSESTFVSACAFSGTSIRALPFSENKSQPSSSGLGRSFRIVVTKFRRNQNCAV